MPARGHATDGRSFAREAAERHLASGEPTSVLADRLGIKRRTITQAVMRLRVERGIAHPRKGGVQAKPTSLARELGERARQDGFLTCCQTTGHHRFDCPEQPRGEAYLPIAPMTASQLVDRLRRERAA